MRTFVVSASLLLLAGTAFSLPAAAKRPVDVITPDGAVTAEVDPAPALAPDRIAILAHITDLRERARDPQRVAWLDAMGTFYAQPGARAIFIAEDGLTHAAGEMMEELGRAEEWGLSAADYDTPSAYGVLDTPEARARAEVDLALTALTYAFHANGGRLDPTELSLWYDMKPKPVDAPALLATFARAGDAGAVLRDLHPKHPQFVALREAYLDIIKPNREKPDSQAVEAAAEPEPDEIILNYGRSVREGQRNPQIALLRKRLDVPAGDPDDETLYDRELRNAVDSFMRTQGWRRKYVFDDKVREKLNALASGDVATGQRPASVSKRALLVNMEKWRLLPRSFGDFHIWNNLPSFMTEVVKNGEVIHEERIIIGKESLQTPVFKDQMTHIIFKPEWGVPSSIKIKTLLPRLAAGDYDVLRRRGMRIAVNGRSVDPRTINWGRRDIRTVPIIMGASSSNPLGNMKFMFPNKHAVYMHDTPERHLFKNRNRTFSSGCIRVRNPDRFAEVLTQEALGWTAQDVENMLGRRADENVRIDLPKPIPVYNTYFTVVADADGKLRTYSDIYGHDKRISQALLDGKSADVIARSDPARLHAARMDEMATNVPTYREETVADNYGYGFGYNSSPFANFWGQPAPSQQQKKKKSSGSSGGAPSWTLNRPFWEGN